MGLLDGKVAIVTGAGHGIGRGEALELAEQGAKVVVNDLGVGVAGEDSDERPAETVAKLIQQRGGEAVADLEDIADWEGAGRLVQHAIDEFGRLDILVNNAGILRDSMIVSLTETDFDAVVRVHLKGTVACIHHAAAYWRAESKEGRQPRAAIVNTVSSAGLQGNVGQVAYGAAKAGIAATTVIASLELARYGVRANAVAPGGFTRMVGVAMPDIEVKEPEEFDEFDRMSPGNSAPMVAWLASDEALHVTGQVFRAVGSSIAHYEPWKLGAEITTEDRWDATKIGPEVNATIFRSRAPGLKMP
ncbi:MAG: SDR family NAD(P)-dependent oxidoreductase [Actinobacteria bacterium]|nr:SDR family NAD(P)-dependent oxidoreductase [Actinomycetota bacterium]